MRKPDVESWEALLAEEIEAGLADGLDDPLIEDLALFDPDSGDEVQCGTRDLDSHRWELDPASADDWNERIHGWPIGPSLRWRHFGH